MATCGTISSRQNNTRNPFNFLSKYGIIVVSIRYCQSTFIIKRNIFNNNLEDIEKLNKIFRILITVYNRGLKERQFELICPEIGSKYDSSTSAIKEMKSIGTVKEVLLIGYKNTADQNVHKAIISVNEQDKML